VGPRRGIPLSLRQTLARALFNVALPSSASPGKEMMRMRKVVAYELLSLDGVAEQPDEFFTDFDDVMEDNLGRVIATQNAAHSS
jgi:hypothetical protein